MVAISFFRDKSKLLFGLNLGLFDIVMRPLLLKDEFLLAEENIERFITRLFVIR